jgi:hypothetical protein
MKCCNTIQSNLSQIVHSPLTVCQATKPSRHAHSLASYLCHGETDLAPIAPASSDATMPHMLTISTMLNITHDPPPPSNSTISTSKELVQHLPYAVWHLRRPLPAHNKLATTAAMHMAAPVAAAVLLPAPTDTLSSHNCCPVEPLLMTASYAAELSGKPQGWWRLLVLLSWSLPEASLHTHVFNTLALDKAGGTSWKHSTPQHSMTQQV